MFYRSGTQFLLREAQVIHDDFPGDPWVISTIDALKCTYFLK